MVGHSRKISEDLHNRIHQTCQIRVLPNSENSLDPQSQKFWKIEEFHTHPRAKKIGNVKFTSINTLPGSSWDGFKVSLPMKEGKCLLG
jgi:hypothetical protein